ncbi:WDR83 [Cervus elaphus hippelaphus]|uniref:WDR83 n=1 Tax=Cervus elaphus hippelaphus TaxID=46360 RepID=A0A212D023_CEREH|nr:WDR83 [Cervus elaphus hippelaphus]
MHRSGNGRAVDGSGGSGIQGALALALPVGPGVVQSLAYHPTEPCLLTAMGGSIQCWREETYEAEGAPS